MEITSVSPVAWQLGVGLQASGIRIPEATVDLTREGRQAAEVASARVRVETTTQPTSPTLPVQDDEKRRRNPYIGRRRQLLQLLEEESSPRGPEVDFHRFDVSV